MNTKKIYKILTILLIMQWAFIQILAQYPSFIEKYYSNGFYQYISKGLRMVFGKIPFSLGDILYGILLILILKEIFSVFRNKKVKLKSTLFKVGGIISVIFFLFHFNWGLNYFREPLHKKLHIENSEYSVDELVDFTKKLIQKTNQIQVAITKNDTVIVTNQLSKPDIKEKSQFAYEELEKIYPQFSFEKTSVKHSLFSVPLTYMGFAGYLNPITNEAQVNSLIPKNSYPVTVCHELAHQIGIASESEANFVGYLASINYSDNYFNYSGYLMALRYCLAEIYRKDPTKFEELKPLINKGILKDIQQNQNFWKKYQNWSEKYFKKFYDTYLKANKQKDGIKGYSKMVTLLINYHKTHKI